jgi:Trp operon repressor
MVTMGRPKAELPLSDEERQELRALLRRRSTAQALALRARIVLLCETSHSNRDLAEEVGVSEQTVGKWRRRFVALRL